LYSIIDNTTGKGIDFIKNGHTLGFYPQTQLDATMSCAAINFIIKKGLNSFTLTNIYVAALNGAKVRIFITSLKT